MIDELIALKMDVEALKTAFSNMITVGTIEEGDGQKGYRMKTGEDEDGPQLSPWLPHPEDAKSSVPFKRGQIVANINPNGDPRQGFLVRAGYSDEHASPNSNMEANVFEDAGVRVEIVDGKLLVTADAEVLVSIGGTTFSLTAGGSVQTGGAKEHDGKNVGKDHTHKNVTTGPSNTGIPNA